MPSIKSGSKYYPLYEYLQGLPHGNSGTSLSEKPAELTLSFSEIERILKTSLPASASRKSWWSNRDSPSALQASAWIQAGYHVDSVDFAQQIVIFREFSAEYTIQRADDAILWNQEAIRSLRKHMSLTQAKFAQQLGVRRQTVSEWENGVYEPDRSTAKHLGLLAEQQGFE